MESHLESWLLRLYVSFTTTSFSFLCMNINQNAVTANKIIFIMPNANAALSIAHSLFKLKSNPLLPLTPFVPKET